MTRLPGLADSAADLGGVDDPDVAAAVGGQRDAGVGGHRGRRGHAGDDLEPHPALAHAAASAAARQNRNGSPPNRRTTSWPALAALTSLPRVRLQGRRSRRRHAAGRSRWPAARSISGAGDDQVGLAEQVGGAQRQQPLVARAGADEGDPARGRARCRAGRRGLRGDRGCGVPAGFSVTVWGSLVIVPVADVSVGHRHIPSRAAARAARRPPRGRGCSASAGWAARARRAAPYPPSAATTTGLQAQCARPGGIRADRGAAACLQRGEHAAFRRRSPHGWPGHPRRPAAPARSCSAARHSTASAPCPAAGQHLVRLEDLGDRVQPADPGQPRVGEHDRVELAGRHLGQPGAGVAAHRDRAHVRPQQQQLRGPARRAGADPRRRRGRSASLAPSLRDQRVPRVVPRPAPRPARCRRPGRWAGP